LYGSPQSGKTTVLQLALNGRKGIIYISFKDLENGNKKDFINAIMKQLSLWGGYDYFPGLNDNVTIEDICTSFYKAFRNRSEADVMPLILFDDVNSIYKDSNHIVIDGFESLMNTIIKLNQENNVNVILVTNDINIVSPFISMYGEDRVIDIGFENEKESTVKSVTNFFSKEIIEDIENNLTTFSTKEADEMLKMNVSEQKKIY